MKAHTGIKSIILCIATAMTVGIGGHIKAESHMGGEGKMMMSDSSVMNRCQALGQQQRDMMAEFQSQDAELVDLVTKLDSAPEDKKLSMMADILTKMVNQRVHMHQRMGKMRDMMFRHTMMHIRMGKETLEQCPLAKDVMNGEDKAKTSGDKD